MSKRRFRKALPARAGHKYDALRPRSGWTFSRNLRPLMKQNCGGRHVRRY